MEARKQAARLVEDGSAEIDAHLKVQMYANVARVLGPALRNISFEPNTRNFNDLEDCMEVATERRCRLAVTSLPDETLAKYDAITKRYMEMTGFPAKSFFERIKDGMDTFLDQEMCLLRTLALQQRRERFTREAILASHRVLFPFAMSHIFHPNPLSGYTTTAYEGRPLKSVVVLSEDVMHVSATDGLSLRERPPLEHPGVRYGVTEKQPRIGCPITLIQGALQDLHVASADAAISAGLLVPAGEQPRRRWGFRR